MGSAVTDYDVPLSTPYGRDHLEAEQHERLTRIVEGSPTLIVALSPAGAVRFMNAAAEHATGFMTAELTGQLWWTLCNLGDEHDQVEMLLHLLEQGDVASYELPLYARTGAQRWIRWTFCRQLSLDGKLQELLGWGIDVTHEGARREQGDHALRDRAHRPVDAELMAATYYLNTTLAPLLLGLQLQQRRAQQRALSSAEREELDTLVGQTLKLARLITALLHLFEAQADPPLAQLTPVDLGTLVSERLELLTPTLRGQPLVVLLPAERIVVRGETTLLEQLVELLLDDAVRASPPRSCIEVRVEDTGTHARLTMIDQGPVVPRELLPAHCVPFAPGGMDLPRLGIGLGMAQHIAARHGGTIEVRRTPCDEHSVVVTLPRVAARAS